MYLNLVQAWAQVDQTAMAIGRASYPSYRASLQLWSEFYGIGLVPTVEAFVALSPNNDYHGNLRSLSSVMFSVAAGISFDRLTVSTYRACALRAINYLTGKVSFLDTVNGRKITSFRHNILYQKYSDKVTVDGHMVAVWLADTAMTMSQANEVMSNKLYTDIEAGVRKLARANDMAPCDVQACLWVSRKQRQGIKFDDQQDLFSGKSRWDEVAEPQHYPPFQRKLWGKWRAERV